MVGSCSQPDRGTGSFESCCYPWLITDFVTVSTLMYFADHVYASDCREFDERGGEACPPQFDGCCLRLW